MTREIPLTPPVSILTDEHLERARKILERYERYNGHLTTLEADTATLLKEIVGDAT